jgi:diadenosine tetraphosphate (Ap4A) HIT family hydrolase
MNNDINNEDTPLDIDDVEVPWKNPIREDFHVAVYEDKYPVTKGHLLFVPKYNTTLIIAQAFNDAYRWGRQMVRLGECDSYNIGMNIGEEAGQTVPWPHIHLIPRRKGDVADPTGGVRAVAGWYQANYKDSAYRNPND